MDIEVFSKDYAKDLAANYKPKSFNTPALPCKAVVTISGDVSDADYNILRDRLGNAIDAKGLESKLVLKLAKLAEEADEDVAERLLADPDGAKKSLAEFKKGAEAALAEFEKQVATAFTDSWNGFVKDREAYKTYKIKIAIDVSVAAVSLAGSIASLATAATPAAPVTLVLGLYGIIKNATKLVTVSRNAMMEAETVAAELTKDCESLKKKLAKLEKLQDEAEKKDEAAKKEAAKAKTKEKVKELAVSFANKVTGDLVGVKVSTVEGVASKASLYGNKCRGIQEGTRDVAQQYLDSIEKTLALGKYCDELEAHFVKFATGLSYSAKARAEIAKLNAKVQAARKAWLGMQESMKELNADAEASEKRYQDNAAKSKKFAETAKKAQEAFKTKNWAEAGRWLGVAADVGLTAGGGGAGNWANSDKAIATSLKLVQIFEKEAITELKKKM